MFAKGNTATEWAGTVTVLVGTAVGASDLTLRRLQRLIPTNSRITTATANSVPRTVPDLRLGPAGSSGALGAALGSVDKCVAGAVRGPRTSGGVPVSVSRVAVNW